jgi:hypothetical protein
LSLLLHGTKSDFLDFQGKTTSAPRDRTAKLAKSSETTVQKKQFKRMQSLSGQCPQTSQRNKWHSAIQDSSKGLTNEDFSRCRWSQLCQTSKSNQSQEIFLTGGRGFYACAVIFKPSGLLEKGSHAFGPDHLFKKKKQYNFWWYLTSA